MAGRQLSDWLTGYLEITKNTEPPKSYHTWTGLTVMSACLQRRVYLNWGYETIYPNLYVVLVGPSGRCRKGTAITIGRELVAKTGIPMAAEAITREALIRLMKDSMGNFTDATTGNMCIHCSLMCISAELSVFLGQNDIQFLSHLTDWYDSMDKWTYRTKGCGTDEINGMCLTLLGATAPDWISSMLPQEAMGGGFTSRVIFIVEFEKGKIIDEEPKLTPEIVELRDALINDLEIITNMTGQFTMTPEARAAYQSWYRNDEQAIRDGHPPIADGRFAGYCERRATHLRKLSMVLSASRSSSRLVEASDFARAKSILTAAERNMSKAFGGAGSARYSDVTEKVLDYISKHRKVARSRVMQLFYRDMDFDTLKIVESVLYEMKAIRIEPDRDINEVWYVYTGDKT